MSAPIANPINALKLRKFMQTLCPALIVISSVLSCSGASIPKCIVIKDNSATFRESLDEPPIIKDDTIVFYTISQVDYDLLVAQKPEMSDSIEVIMDFNHYASMIESKLCSLGYTVIYGSWHEVTVQIGEKEFEKVTFKPSNLVAILMKARGKRPKLVTTFNGAFYNMADIISEYFKISLR